MKEHKFIFLTRVSLPSSLSLLKVPNDDDDGGGGGIGSRGVNDDDDDDDDDQHYRKTYDITLLWICCHYLLNQLKRNHVTILWDM